MEVKELGHLVLYVRDLETSAAFYRDVLGFWPLIATIEGMRAAAVSSGRTHHELLGRGSVSARCVHSALRRQPEGSFTPPPTEGTDGSRNDRRYARGVTVEMTHS